MAARFPRLPSPSDTPGSRPTRRWITLAGSALLLGGCSFGGGGTLFDRKRDNERPNPPEEVGGNLPSGAKKVAFADITGAPGEFKTRLATAIGRQAALQGLPLASGGSADATYTIQGFVSTTTSPANALIHVWDIETRDGQRAQRLNRETPLPADMAMVPWPIVDQPTVDKVAADVVAAVLAWQQTLSWSRSAVISQLHVEHHQPPARSLAGSEIGCLQRQLPLLRAAHITCPRCRRTVL